MRGHTAAIVHCKGHQKGFSLRPKRGGQQTWPEGNPRTVGPLQILVIFPKPELLQCQNDERETNGQNGRCQAGYKWGALARWEIHTPCYVQKMNSPQTLLDHPPGDIHTAVPQAQMLHSPISPKTLCPDVLLAHM